MKPYGEISSCFYCGGVAEAVHDGRVVCRYCRAMMIHRRNAKIREIVGGMLFLAMLVFMAWLIMAVTDYNWIPVR